ncbi:MAG: hypothetical protein JWN34_1016 [Bryobacterales bacterium]|jgi:hypothetical protein|nr:hypothetical protein [Bryobacterales bacterium]
MILARRLTFLTMLAASAAFGQTARTPAKVNFRVAEPVISQFEDGAAISGNQRVVPGETVFFRFSALDFKVGENSKVMLTGHAQVFDPRGVPIAPIDETAVATSLREEDKEWRPRFHFQFQVPSLAPSGTYKVVYDAIDDQTKATATGQTTFAVEGREVQASPQLVIRNLAFYRTADDEAPVRVPAYRSGDLVWVKFDVTGYKYGEQNSMDVAYDVNVTAPGGRQLFNQENAAVEKNQAFYPQPWVPGAFSLTLQANMTPGDYAITITAHDGIGKQDASAKGVFRVE